MLRGLLATALMATWAATTMAEGADTIAVVKPARPRVTATVPT